MNLACAQPVEKAAHQKAKEREACNQAIAAQNVPGSREGDAEESSQATDGTINWCLYVHDI
jgi:hypothetical protein